jgi:rfaE bifunctional protein kinase chain/domain
MFMHQDFQENAFKNLHILVIGDAMIDRYYYGEINRQSPEADVPIVDVDQVENRLGGAANVALNIVRLGAKAHLMTFQGNDEHAVLFEDLLKAEGIAFSLAPSNRKTTIKTRLYNSNEYVMRYDIEDTFDLEEKELNDLLRNIETACQTLALNAVILQDYNKGVFTAKSIKAIVGLLNRYKIPIAVDPKEQNFFAFQNVDLFKPNLKEINKALNLSLNGEDELELKKACQVLQEKISCERVLLTLAQNGAVAFKEDVFYHVEAHPRKVVDVSGAGDTVIAMAGLLLALKFSIDKILFYSNLAGGIVIEERGVKALTWDDWAKHIQLH